MEGHYATLVRTVVSTLRENSKGFDRRLALLCRQYPSLVHALWPDILGAYMAVASTGPQSRKKKEWLRQVNETGVRGYVDELLAICQEWGLRGRPVPTLPGSYNWWELLHAFAGERPPTMMETDLLQLRDVFTGFPSLGIPAPPSSKRGRPRSSTDERQQKELQLAQAIGLRLSGLKWRKIADRSGQDNLADEQQLREEAKRLAERLNINL